MYGAQNQIKTWIYSPVLALAKRLEPLYLINFKFHRALLHSTAKVKITPDELRKSVIGHIPEVVLPENFRSPIENMHEASKRRHIFISHHHADDDEVSNLISLLSRKGYDIRNSSIRAKPANKERLKQKLVSDETIRRLLRMKISWAGTVVVLIGKETHSRPWVNWEIEQANKQGKRIVGVYVRGGTEADKPAALENYASAIVGWNTDAIMAAIDGTENPFQNPDGSSRQMVHTRKSLKC